MKSAKRLKKMRKRGIYLEGKGQHFCTINDRIYERAFWRSEAYDKKHMVYDHMNEKQKQIVITLQDFANKNARVRNSMNVLESFLQSVRSSVEECTCTTGLLQKILQQKSNVCYGLRDFREVNYVWQTEQTYEEGLCIMPHRFKEFLKSANQNKYLMTNQEYEKITRKAHMLHKDIFRFLDRLDTCKAYYA